MENKNTMPKILIVDDLPENIFALERLLKNTECEIFKASNGNEALSLTLDNEFALILADINMPEMNGFEMTSLLRSNEKTKRIPLIFLTASFIETHDQFKGYELGAVDFILKPYNEFILLQKVNVFLDLYNQRKLLEQEILQRERYENILALDQLQFSNIIGECDEMKNIFSLIQRVAKTDATVMVLGESGTGKELIAHAIHTSSTRNKQPFICLNCAALPETLLESELFGYEQGAYTGAENNKMGRFELADKGTLFIDEIGELSLNAQVKLLRVLQEQKFERVGGTKSISVNVRIIVATNRNLEKMIEEGKFREDLFYRLNIFPISLPPLRTRGKDIILLTEYFLKKYSIEYFKKNISPSQEVSQILQNYQWRGNVRELQNIISRAVLLCDGNILLPEHLLIKVSSEQKLIQEALNKNLTEEELNIIYAKAVYQKLNQNKNETARVLNISYKTLINRLEK